MNRYVSQVSDLRPLGPLLPFLLKNGCRDVHLYSKLCTYVPYGFPTKYLNLSYSDQHLSVCKLFTLSTSLALKPLGQFQPNFVENMLGDGDLDLFK